MNFPDQCHVRPLSELAKKYNISQSSAHRIAKEMGQTKTRQQYLQDAHIRRKLVFELRLQGMKYREIAELLNISADNAKKLAKRFNPLNPLADCC